MTKQEKAEQAAYALEWLHKHLDPGATVYTVLRHVSRSGMLRRISFVIPHGAEVLRIDHWIARVLDMTVHKDGGIIVKGCGMDMGYHVVYNLSRAMFPSGTAERKDGGYALRHSWL